MNETDFMRIIRSFSIIRRGDSNFWFLIEKKLHISMENSTPSLYEVNNWVNIYISLSRVGKGSTKLWKTLIFKI